MNLYILKRSHYTVYELATGNTPEEAAKQIEYFFGWDTKVDPAELEFYSEVEADHATYWAYIDPRTDEYVYPCPLLFKQTYGFPHPELAYLEKEETA